MPSGGKNSKVISLGAGGGGGGGDMLKSEYDTNDNGFVNSAETLRDKMILVEPVTVGQLVFYTDDLPIGTIQQGGIADKDIVARRPAIGVAVQSGITGETIDVVEAGLAFIDTNSFTSNTIVSLGNNGSIVNNAVGFNQQIGVVQVVGGTGIGTVYVKQGSIEKASIPSALLDGETLRYDTATGSYVGTADINTTDIVDFHSKELICKSVVTESASVDIGPGVTLSDRGGALQSRSNVTGRDYISVDYKVDDTGTDKPLYDSRLAKVIHDVVQPDDATSMIGITSYAVVPVINQDIHRVYVKLINPLTNYRARVISDVTGMVVKYIPSRNDWDNGTGLSFTAGEQFFNLSSPLAEDAGFPLTVELMADQSIDVLGDGVNPWRAVDSQDIISYEMLDERDISKHVREFFTSNGAGDDVNDGLSTTSPKKTLNAAIAAIASLSPPPSVTDRASITDLGSSQYNLASDITLQSGTLVDLRASAIKGDDGVAIEVNSDCNLVVGRLEPGDTAGSTAVRMAGQNCGLTATNIIIGAVGNTQRGIRVVGQNVRIDVESIVGLNSEGELLLLDGTANNTQPAVINRMLMGGFFSRAIVVNTAATESVLFNVGLISDQGHADCLGLRVISGNVKMNVNEMDADIDIETGNTVAMVITKMEDDKTITIAAGSTLNIWCIEGAPTIVNNGVINGYIGGVYYGDAITSHYRSINVDTLVANNVHKISVDPSVSEVTITLATEPVDGESKTVWMPNNLNPVNFVSESPSYPVAPPAQIAPANLQAQWILDNDWLDNFDNSHDLALQGAGGAFSPITINGNLVNGFDFQQLVYLEATGYAGILGGSARSFSTWYRANAGQPVADETLISWGEDVADGGGSYWEVELRGAQGYLWVNNRNASRRYNFTGGLAAANLFDGNPHHIGVMQVTGNMGTVVLLIDGIPYTRDFQDTFPSCNTKTGSFLKVGAGYNGLQPLNATLYDTRIWNRGLSTEEMIQVMNQELSGGQTITGAPDNFVFDMTYNANQGQWIFGDGLPLFMQENRARIEALEAGQIPLIEDYPTNETDPNLKLVPDTVGGVEWVQDPLGVTFDSALVLTGSEVANRFIYVGTGNVNITLPPSAATTLDYTIFIENKGDANGTVTVLLDGADTLTGGSALAIGDGSTVTKTTATNYNSNLVTPATTNTIEALQDDDIALGTITSAIFGAGKKVEDALQILSVDALVSVTSDATLTGDGTLGDPLGVANEFTTGDGTKLDGIEAGAEANNISDVNATDLTDGGETALHTHPSSPLPSIAYTTNANIDGLDVTTLAPVGLLFIDLPQNREIRSLAGGVDGQVVKIVNLTTFNFKAKHQTGTFQMIRCEGETDKTASGYGGFELIYNAATGYWYDINHQ